MPDQDVTLSIGAEDDVTPALNKIKGTINEVTQSTAGLVEEGRLLTEGFERAGIAIANAMRLGSQEQKAAMQAYLGSGGGGGGGGGAGGAGGGRGPAAAIDEARGSIGGLMGEMTGMAGTFLKWGVMWQALEAVFKGVEAGIGQVVGSFQAYDQWSNKLGADNQALSGTFTGLINAAIMTGTSIQETSKRAADFYSYGFDAEGAVRATESVQLAIKKTGVDMTQAFEKANVLGASIEDLRTVGKGTDDEATRQEAIRQIREENTRKYTQFEMEQRQQAEAYSLSDSNRAIAQYTEAHQREVSEDLAERQRATRQDLDEKIHAIDQERAESKRAIKEEMEDRHRAAVEEMADRHRIAREAEADADRLHNRQMGAAGAVKGLTEAAMAGTGVPAELQRFPGLNQAYDRIRNELEKGYQQFAKDTGVSAQTAKELTQAGFVSPGEILQEAKVPVEEERIKAERARAKEEREGGKDRATEEREGSRSQAKEDAKQQEINYQARKKMEQDLGNEERKVRKELTAERLKIEHEIADSERDLMRRNAKERDEITKQRLADELNNQKLIVEGEAKVHKKAEEEREKYAPYVAGAAPEGIGYQAGMLAAPSGAVQTYDANTADVLGKIRETLAQLLSGG